MVVRDSQVQLQVPLRFELMAPHTSPTVSDSGNTLATNHAGRKADQR